MELGKKLVIGCMSLTIVTATAHASKSVFIISKHRSPSEAQAYKIESDQVKYQADVKIFCDSWLAGKWRITDSGEEGKSKRKM